MRQSLFDGNTLNKKVDETDGTKGHRQEHQDHHEAHQHFLQVADFTGRGEEGRGLSEECIDTSELDSSLDFATNDSRAHFTAVTLVECNGKGLSSKSSLIHINLRVVHTAIGGDSFEMGARYASLDIIYTRILYCGKICLTRSRSQEHQVARNKQRCIGNFPLSISLTGSGGLQTVLQGGDGIPSLVQFVETNRRVGKLNK